LNSGIFHPPMDSYWSEWPAPAKLNLFLHIVGRRADGYHLLQTVFQLLDWGDTLRLKVRKDGVIHQLTPLPNVPETADLCVRAARLLKQHTQCPLGVDIALEKRIPMGGGLGGGSSDAATTLVALNELWSTQLPTETLMSLGATLGADVPVFIQGRSAWAEGIGEQLTPVDLPERYFVVADPKVNVSTSELFQSAELTRNSTPMTMADFVAGAMTENVFEPLVRRRYPAIDNALQWLGSFDTARLTGTGGCVFLPVDSQKTAEAIAKKCPLPLIAYVAKGVAVSPLQEVLKTNALCENTH